MSDDPIAAWGADSETGRLTDVLLGSPEFFKWQPVSAVSRESMRRGETFDHQTAMAQHARMVEAYESAGVTVRMIEARPDLTYSVFTRDSSVMTPWGAIICMLQARARRGDYVPALRFYQRAGIPIWNYVTAGHFEGGDLIMAEPGLVFCGYGGERSDEAGAEQVAGWFRDQGWEAHTVPFPPYFVHLDVTLGIAAPKLAVVCTEAHQGPLVEILTGHSYQIIEASYGEAIQLGCNMVSLGADRVLSTQRASRVNEQLRAHGLDVLDPDLSMFTLGGGGPHCLSQYLRREPSA